ncbi:membrane protein [Caballeronia udeis]|uniref:Membrane protein n=1 Tax=Caballeronia udeis TaxID=1232866 RepID=A0A158J5Z7_9BURK|nr:membrane protein [Caballeronia udeis]
MKSKYLSGSIVQPMLGSLIVSVTLMATSGCVYAQTSTESNKHQLTRAEVLHELEELEAVGYNPSQGDDGDYPADLLAAEQKVAAKHQAERNALAGVGQAAQIKTTSQPSP